MNTSGRHLKNVKRSLMANQFEVDKSDDFQQRMTLVNEVSSDKYLEQHRRQQDARRESAQRDSERQANTEE